MLSSVDSNAEYLNITFAIFSSLQYSIFQISPLLSSEDSNAEYCNISVAILCNISLLSTEDCNSDQFCYQLKIKTVIWQYSAFQFFEDSNIDIAISLLLSSVDSNAEDCNIIVAIFSR